MFNKLKEKYHELNPPAQPLTEKQFLQLLPVKPLAAPLVKYKSKSLNNCRLCHTNIPYGDDHICLPACGHNYHVECIKEWLLEKTNRCPYCNSKVMVMKSHPYFSPPVVDRKQKNSTFWNYLSISGGGDIGGTTI